MTLHPELEDFLKENMNYIRDDDFDSLYTVCRKDLRRYLTQALLDSNIEPLPYMSTIYASMYESTPIKKLNIPDNIKSIESDAFRQSSIVEIQIPDIITELPRRCFSECLHIKKVQLSDNLEVIARDCFYYSGIQELYLPDSLMSIFGSAFGNCPMLTYISIPADIEYLGPDLFSRDKELRTIEYRGTKSQWDRVTKVPDLFESSYVEKISCVDGDIVRS